MSGTFREERPIARRVEHTGHAEHALARKARHLERDIAHHVERVRDHHDDRVRRGLLDLGGHRLHDARVGVEQIVARHPRLARDAGGDDDDLRARRLRVAVRADHARIEELDRRRLPLVERLPLRDALDDIYHDDLTRQFLLCEPLRRRRAHVARADDRDLVYHFMESCV